MTGAIYAALVHYPIRGPKSETIATAITNIDVHDIARSATTFGLHGYFIVTPITAQRALVDRILAHWKDGAGGQRIPARARALSIAESCRSLEDVRNVIHRREGQPPRVVVTAANPEHAAKVRTFEQERQALQNTKVPTLIVFGTGHGLADEVLEEADVLLEPVRGVGEYNHLSVRAAAAIIFDRLWGRETVPKS